MCEKRNKMIAWCKKKKKEEEKRRKEKKAEGRSRKKERLNKRMNEYGDMEFWEKKECSMETSSLNSKSLICPNN